MKEREDSNFRPNHHTHRANFYLFSNLKKWFRRKKFSGDSEVIDTANDYFEELDKLLYKTNITNLKHCWVKFFPTRINIKANKLLFSWLFWKSVRRMYDNIEIELLK